MKPEWLMVFYKFFGLHIVFKAKINVIMLELKIGQQMELQRIILYFDSLDATNILMRDSSIVHLLRDTIEETRDLLFRG